MGYFTKTPFFIFIIHKLETIHSWYGHVHCSCVICLSFHLVARNSIMLDNFDLLTLFFYSISHRFLTIALINRWTSYSGADEIFSSCLHSFLITRWTSHSGAHASERGNNPRPVCLLVTIAQTTYFVFTWDQAVIRKGSENIRISTLNVTWFVKRLSEEITWKKRLYWLNFALHRALHKQACRILLGWSWCCQKGQAMARQRLYFNCTVIALQLHC